MKTLQYFSLLPLVLMTATGQMPDSFDATGRSAQAQNGVQNNDPMRIGETPPPQVFGMELPLLDPSTDTVSYGGAKFDVGNNALVRERFEKFLTQEPDDSEQARLYRKQLQQILDFTERHSGSGSKIGSKTLVKIGMGLYKLSDYPADGDQGGALASAIVSALDALRANRRRDKATAELDAEIDQLIDKTNKLNNRNTSRGNGGGQAGDIKNPNAGKIGMNNTFLIAANSTKIAEKKTQQGANNAANQASLAVARLNYQGLAVWFLLQRRYDHAVIAARVYRHIFRDGDVTMKLDKDSDAYKLFTGISGVPPSINAVDTMASNLRSEVDKSMEAVYGALAQNKLGVATNRLIAAVAVGDYMQSVVSFPAEHRKRIDAYWQLRKRALTTLNARDYDGVEAIAAEMKKMDVDFDDSQLLSYTSARKRQSNFALRSARKAFEAGNDEEFRRLATEAAVIWPRNPNLDKGEQEIARVDAFEPEMEEFRRLMARKEFRNIYNERERFQVVAADNELKKQYTEVVEFVGATDIMLASLKTGSETDRTVGPCLAYEQMTLLMKKDERYSADKVFTDAYGQYAALAHDFVQALTRAEDCEKRAEYGSALSCYFRARCFFPKSTMAQEGIDRTTKIIISATY